MSMEIINDLDIDIRNLIYKVTTASKTIKHNAGRRIVDFGKEHSFTPEMCQIEFEMRIENVDRAIEHLRESERLIIQSIERLKDLIKN